MKKFQIHTVHFSADAKLTKIIEEKSEKLQTFFSNIVNCEVFLILEPDSHKENKIVELKVDIPGEHLFVKERSAKFEVAFEKSLNVMKRRLKRFKEKHYDHHKK